MRSTQSPSHPRHPHNHLQLLPQRALDLSPLAETQGADYNDRQGTARPTTNMRLFTTSHFFMFFPPLNRGSGNNEKDGLSSSEGSVGHQSGSQAKNNKSNQEGGAGRAPTAAGTGGGPPHTDHNFSKDVIIVDRTHRLHSSSNKNGNRHGYDQNSGRSSISSVSMDTAEGRR